MTNLSKNFELSELVVTSAGLPNTPGQAEVAALRRLCEAVLQPWRDRVGRLRVTSGYRSPAVNRAIGGSSTSQHMRGEAADVVPLDVPLAEAWESLLGAGLPIDQAIVYQRAEGRGWIHVSHSVRRTRGELLVQPADRPGQYVPWSTWRGPLVLP